ncbi:hypothetical protein [Microbacterium sp. USHLN186]|uniref:hypothetical protein n=1 Tax=Microbacterium sp. USHLN186 TaxID=3081286 RepID=UPI003018657B
MISTILDAGGDVVNVHVGLPQTIIVMVSLATAMVFGLAVLRRPSSATTAWGIAFGIGLLATYVWAAAEQAGLGPLRALASGLMLAFEPLVWLGLRLFAGRRVPWFEAGAFVIMVPTALALSAATEAFSLVFSLAFACGGVFAGLIAIDLARLRIPSRDVTLPLLLVSGAFAIAAALNLAWRVIGPVADAGEQISVLREVNGVGTMVTSVCAAVTILLLVRSDTSGGLGGDAGPHGSALHRGEDALRERFARIRARHDASWSLLDVRLDDPGDLREASGQSDFAAIVQRFRTAVVEALPPSADIVRGDGTQLLALVPGNERTVEHHVRTALERVSSVDEQDELSVIRVSASIGWATVLESDFDLDTLTALAATRADNARSQGGDRWESGGQSTVTTTITIA